MCVSGRYPCVSISKEPPEVTHVLRVMVLLLKAGPITKYVCVSLQAAAVTLKQAPGMNYSLTQHQKILKSYDNTNS